ncbi:MAG TPA: single-stranded DNA-binding protein [Rikenellaceae bacterium]|nr:single-stranded DNA-binding protein [Rikenellaceae bacterium]
MSLNKVMLIGNVGKDPEIRHLDNDNIVAKFTLATTEKYRDRDGKWQEQTEWHNIVCWRSLAERAEKYVKRGTQLFVEGKIRTREWLDRNTDQKKISIDIVADNFQVLGRRSEAPQQPQNSHAPASFSIPEDDLPDDSLPF